MFGTWSPPGSSRHPGCDPGQWTAPFRASADGVVVLADGWPRPATASPPGGPSDDPAARVLAAYRAQGPRFLAGLAGPFALVIVDEQRRHTLLAVDRMGIRPLAYAVTSGGSVIFGSSALDVARSLSPDPRLDPQAIHDYMHLHMVPSPGTIYPGVGKVAPGACVTIINGVARAERYWRPAFGEVASPNEATLREELHSTLRTAVRHCRTGGSASGAFLSGGLDSSTVVGVQTEVSGGPVNTFSVGFDTEGYDELAFARIAVGRFGARPHEYVVTPADVARAVPVIAGAYDEPFGNSSAVPTYYCARLAREAGIDVLLAGDGGDEIFAGNPHYTRQQLFQHYERLPAGLRRLLERIPLGAVPEDAVWPLGKLRSYVQQASIPLPRRLHSWNFMLREPASSIFDPAFMDRIDQDHWIRVMEDTWREVADADVLDQLLYFDWKFVLADNDLRKVGRMCALAGVRVEFPMLATELVDFALRIPTGLKIRGQELRHFYKQAMRGFLPDPIIDKTKHGFGLPFGVWLKTSPELIGLVDQSFHSLGKRQIFRQDFLDSIRTLHRDGHPGYYGYVIWDLLMLEQWLQAHGLTVG